MVFQHGGFLEVDAQHLTWRLERRVQQVRFRVMKLRHLSQPLLLALVRLKISTKLPDFHKEPEMLQDYVRGASLRES